MFQILLRFIVVFIKQMIAKHFFLRKKNYLLKIKIYLIKKLLNGLQQIY